MILKPYRKFLVLLVVVSLLSSLFDGFSIAMLVPLLGTIQKAENYNPLPGFFRVIVGFLNDYPIETQILLALTCIVLAVIIKNVFLGISTYLGFWLTRKLAVDLRCRAMDTLMQVGIGFYSKTKIGHLVEKVLNHTAAVEELIKWGTDFIVKLATFIVLLGLLLLFSWKLTVFTLIFALIIGLAVSVYISRMSKLGKKAAVSGEELAGFLQETLSGMQVIKSFTKESSHYRELKEKTEEHGQDQQILYFRNYMVHIITEVLGIIAIGLLFLGAILMYGLDNKLLLAQLLAFIYVLSRIIPVIKMLNQARGNIVSRWPFLDLVYDLVRLDNKPLIKDGHHSYFGLKQGVQFQAVSFAYSDEKKPALRDAVFSIPKGKTTAIVGKSGAGKSTIVNLLLRFYDPQQGVILIDEVPLQDFTIRSYREKIGLVSQDTFIFNDTVRNNIAFGAVGTPTDDLVIEAAQRAGAHEFIVELPKGYDTILGDRGIRLSGGQRQRISIARAVLKNPEILILDEATSSIDVGTESLIHRAIADLSRNRTVIIIAHRPSTIQGADQIIVLKEGRVAEVGIQSQLLDKKGAYYDLIKLS